MQDLSKLLYNLRKASPDAMDVYQAKADALGMTLTDWVRTTLALATDIAEDETLRTLWDIYKAVRDARAKAVAEMLDCGLTAEESEKAVDTVSDKLAGGQWAHYLPAGYLGRIVNP